MSVTSTKMNATITGKEFNLKKNDYYMLFYNYDDKSSIIYDIDMLNIYENHKYISKIIYMEDDAVINIRGSDEVLWGNRKEYYISPNNKNKIIFSEKIKIEDFDMLNNEDFCNKIINNSPYVLKRIKQQTYEMCISAVSKNGDVLKYVDKDLLTYQLCLTAVKKCGMALEYVDANLLTYEICLAAVSSYGSSIKFIPEKFRTYELCEIAFKNNNSRHSHVISYIENPTYEICELSVKNDGLSFAYIYNHHRQMIDYNLCLLAVKTNCLTLEFMYTIPFNKTQLNELYYEAINQEPLTIKFCKYQTNDLCKSAVSKNGLALKYIYDNLKTYEICKIATEQNVKSVLYINKKYINCRELYNTKKVKNDKNDHRGLDIVEMIINPDMYQCDSKNYSDYIDKFDIPDGFFYDINGVSYCEHVNNLLDKNCTFKCTHRALSVYIQMTYHYCINCYITRFYIYHDINKKQTPPAMRNEGYDFTDEYDDAEIDKFIKLDNTGTFSVFPMTDEQINIIKQHTKIPMNYNCSYAYKYKFNNNVYQSDKPYLEQPFKYDYTRLT